ncbi:MAG: hypothetical protein BGO43_01355 [Gammaproteobacteria bacterium 39-13]|nr:hypothetical protein [Gammaproteobacteria bacterium]OJV89035.1 MAG: hypothetical protein BGO43_01355 [Gammaproteobacteria bacterium 39-13]
MSEFHPSKREPLLNALAKLANELGCQGKIEGEPPFSKAKNKFGLNEILWNQVMMGDKEGVPLSLELGADPNYRVKGKTVLQLAKAMIDIYGSHDIVDALEAYGAVDKPKKRATKSS